MGKTNRNAHGVRTHANKRASKSVLRNAMFLYLFSILYSQKWL